MDSSDPYSKDTFNLSFPSTSGVSSGGSSSNPSVSQTSRIRRPGLNYARNHSTLPPSSKLPCSSTKSAVINRYMNLEQNSSAIRNKMPHSSTNNIYKYTRRNQEIGINNERNHHFAERGYKIDWFDGSMVPTKPSVGISNLGNKRDKDENTRRMSRGPRHPMGFKKLEENSLKDGLDLLLFLDRNFDVLFIDERKPDFIVLLVRCIGKICGTEADAIKTQFLIKLCKSDFMTTMRNYLGNLPYTKINDKKMNMLFWHDPEGFFKDIFIFCESVIDMSPSTAVDHLIILVDSSRHCIEGLQKHQSERFADDFLKIYEDLELKFTYMRDEQEKQASVRDKNAKQNVENCVVETPPQNFREIDILPSKHDLYHKPTFLRPNIIEGAYQDVEHYLDVQFRLMREDFIGPLRDSILEYTKNEQKNKRRYGSARFYRECRILSLTHTVEGPGVKICFNEHLYKRFTNKNTKDRKVKRSSNKGFLFGSLLLLTKDNFEHFICSTVLDSDESEGGVITASIDSQNLSDEMFHGRYLMIESDIYFPPYLNIMEALKKTSLVQKFPFEKYIIHAEASEDPPEILQKHFDNLKLFNDSEMINGEFPPKESLNLDASQYNAFKLALTREFASIQGPPGTGKTYLGLKIVQTILMNLYLNNTNNKVPPILIVCYTNHALDQFLEGLLPYTRKMIRIGGQSRSEVLGNFNLRKQRMAFSESYYEKRREMQELLSEITYYRNAIDSLYSCNEAFDLTDFAIKAAGNDFLNKFNYRSDSIPPLFNWLCMRDKFTGSNVPIVEHYQMRNLSLNDNNEQNDDDIEEFDDVHRQGLAIDDDVYGKCHYKTVKSIKFEDIRKNAYEKYNSLMYNYEKGLITYKELKSEMKNIDFHLRVADILQERLNRGYKNYDMNVDVVAKQRAEHYDMEHRWALYWKWSRETKEIFRKKSRVKMLVYDKVKDVFDELKMIGHMDVLKNSHIVGMTTSGAARLRSLVRSLNSPIVVVEEAAEVMESHIIVSLTPACSHLILIGDHQQLRPITGSYKLAKHFNLDVSLFERMFHLKSNCARLETQHRMRPEISKLITPAIYPVLHDHESVLYFPDVLGVKKNMFFIDHNKFETEEQDSVSKVNEHEVEFALNLAKYLVQQCYEPSDITILAAYSGQMFKMREMRKNISLLKNVRIVVLDNYQGEENKIIILSLVRSNPDGNVGFLSAVNRVCVALSRAKEGFYIIGNKSILIKHQVWENIFGVLEAQNSVGDALELQCQVHRNITSVKTASDFTAVPEGGCSLKCHQLLYCGHNCKKLCHVFDKEHAQYRCMERCEKTICELNHKCQDFCYKECKCMVIVERILGCGHSVKLPCSMDYSTHNCTVIIESTLPICGHKMKHACHKDPTKVICDHNCEDRLPCGHACTMRCHRRPEEDPDHLEYECMMDCANLNKNCSADHKCKKRCYEQCTFCSIPVSKARKCGHKLDVLCHENVEDKTCDKKCRRNLSCGHHCQLNCKDPCDQTKCLVKVKKNRASCQHQVEIACGSNPEAINCTAQCGKIMTCGHICKNRCYMKCDPAKCTEMITNKFYDSVCGHSFKIPCYLSKLDPINGKLKIMKYCKEPCGQRLVGCEHACVGTCGECWGGTLHVPCGEICDRTLLCGHICKARCSLSCPPCNQKCELSCKHSKCKRQCREPCVPCKMLCDKSCEHGRCVKTCGEECSILSCYLPCKKMLECGHPCRGLCGEVCPDICKICKPDQYPTFLFGDEDEDEARFIKLLDCSHSVEVNGMDEWMEKCDEAREGGETEIKLADCPYGCKSKVINTPRYSDYLKRKLNIIQKIKLKAFGKASDKIEKLQELKDRLYVMVNESKTAGLHADESWNGLCQKLISSIKQDLSPLEKKNKHLIVTVSLTKVSTYEVKVDILDAIRNIIKNHEYLSNDFIKYYLKRFLNQIEKCGSVSEQQALDFSNILAKLRTLASALELKCSIHGETPKKIQELITNIFFDMRPFTDFICQGYLDEINNIRKSLSLGSLTHQERKMIVTAMNLKQGHWYCCPNGHPYCITECGGAMQVAKCPECKENIGGSKHALLPTNAVAHFMDGAKHGAWPGTMNIRDYGNLDD